MRTRRNLLAAVGTGVLGGLAGCAGLLEADSDSEPDIDVDDFQGWTPPNPGTTTRLPVTLAEDTWATHRTRARTLFQSVPENPSIPNGVVNAELSSDRAKLRTELESGRDEGQPLDRLDHWRRVRADVANLRGAYRAASGHDDAESVARRRGTSRDRLAALRSGIEYRARDALEAVLVYAPIEDRFDEASRETRPVVGYPEAPLSNVEQAGTAVESVESAAASLDDAEAIHAQYLEDLATAEPQWNRLLRTVEELDYTVDRTWSERVDFLEADAKSRYGTALRGVQADLHRLAIREVRYREDDIRDHERDGRPATAVLEAGRTLASIVVADAVDAGLQNGRIAESPTECSLRTAAQNAVAALESLLEQSHPHLAVAVGVPALNGYRSAVHHLGTSYYGVEYIESQFRFARLFASAAGRVTPFVATRLQQ